MNVKVNPYTRLKKMFSEYVDACVYRNQKTMWVYPKNKLAETWPIEDLYERVAAADQLGYSVELLATDEGLSVRYVKKIPPKPYGI